MPRGPLLLPLLLWAVARPAVAQDSPQPALQTAPGVCPGLHLALSPAANAPDVRGEHVKVPAGSDGKAELALYAWMDDGSSCDAAIFAAPLPQGDGLSPGAKVALRSATQGPLSQLLLVPGSAPQAFSITAEGLATVGTWPAAISVWAGGRAADLLTVDFVVTHAPEAPTLSFVETGASGVSWRTISASVDHTLTLVETGGKVGAHVSIPAIQLAYGDLETRLAAEPAEIDLAPGEARSLRLTGVLPSVGSWAGRVLLDRQGGHDTVVLTVERATATALPTLEALAPPVLVRGLGESVLPVKVRIAEAGSRPVDVSSLSLTRLLPPGSPTTSTASMPATVCWSRAEPDPTQLVDRTCPANGVPEDPVGLPAGGTATWWLTLAVPWEAGSYTGTIEARTLEGDAIPAASFTFSVKHPWYLCLLTVTCGVALSAGLRGWVGQGRAEAMAALPLARLSDAIARLPAGDRVRTLLELEVSRLRDEGSDRAAGIAAAREALENYLSITRLRDVSPLLPQILREPTERDRLATAIEALLARVVDLSVLKNGLEGRNPLVEEAGALYEQVRAAAAAAVKADLDTVEKGITDAQQRLANVPDEALRAALLQRLDAISGPLTSARAAGPQDPATETGAQLARLQAARTALATVVADLDRALPADNGQMGGEGGGTGTYQELLDGLGMPVTLPKLRFGRPPVDSERSLQRWIRSRDAVVLGVVLLLAGVFALAELWWRADAWGTLGDYLAALAWGFGAHVLGGAAQAGGGGSAPGAESAP